MTQQDGLRAEFESFRDGTFAAYRERTDRELREVRALAEADDHELARARSNARLIQALRQTQVEQGQVLAEHGRILVEHGKMLHVLASSMVRLETDVEGLKTDVADLKTDVADLKTNVAGILRILDERLPGSPS